MTISIEQLHTWLNAKKAQETERQRLFRLIEQLVLWENATNETVLAQAQEEID